MSGFLFVLHVVHRTVVDGRSMIGFPLVITDSERDMPGIKPGPLGWQTSALTNELQEVMSFWGCSVPVLGPFNHCLVGVWDHSGLLGGHCTCLK